MKIACLTSLLALSFSAIACVGAPDDGAGEVEDTVGEAQSALTEVVTMGSLGWTDTSATTTDLVLAHRALSVNNKWAQLTTVADWPTLEGVTANSTNLDNCRSAYVQLYVYTRPSGGSWTQIDNQIRFATATVSGGMITSCEATFDSGFCSAYAFSSTEAEFEVDVLAPGGGTQGRKTNTMKFQTINLANCGP